MNLKRSIPSFFANTCALGVVLCFVISARADELQLLWQKSPVDGLAYLGTGNINGTGSADFAGDRLYVLNTNNGILALRIGGSPGGLPLTRFTNVRGTSNSLSFTIIGRANAGVQIVSSTDFSTWTNVQTVRTDATGRADVTLTTPGDHHRFYRAREN